MTDTLDNPHPCLPFLDRARQELETALAELRFGPEGYRGERESVKELLYCLNATIGEIVQADYDRHPDTIAERKALEEQRTPYAGGWAVWGR